MNNIQIFKNTDFGEIRTAEVDGKVMFCGSDVARALGYARTADAISAHCKGVAEMPTPTSGGVQKMKYITEGDVYRLAFGSKLPNAEKFTDWVADEVLPTIRRHGAYMTPDTLEQTIRDPEYIIGLIKGLQAEQAKRMELEMQVEHDRPKVLFADSVAAAKTSILVGELAKLLKQNGVDTGQNRLFQWMRENGYLIRRSGSDYNMPTQRAVDLGLF